MSSAKLRFNDKRDSDPGIISLENGRPVLSPWESLYPDAGYNFSNPNADNAIILNA
jgi:hypothetical protein